MNNTIPIFDGHNDTLLSIYHPGRKVERSFLERSEHGHIDLPRARAGGLGGGFFAIWVPNVWSRHHPKPKEVRTAQGVEMPLPHALDQRYALSYTIMLAARLFELEEAGALKVVRSAGEIQSCLDAGVLAAILHVEGAEFVDPEFTALEVLYRAGLRSLGLVWSRPNAFGVGVPFHFPGSPDIGPGLTEAGKALVRACNRRRIVVDLSHLNEKGFWDVEQISDAPLIATHSGAHAMSASPRNLTDKQLDAVRASGGMVGVNFHTGFLRADGDSRQETTVGEIVRHVCYMVERMGIDSVGFGSDFDGAEIPAGIGDVAGLPNLIAALRDHGYDDALLGKLAWGNWLSVLRRTWGG